MVTLVCYSYERFKIAMDLMDVTLNARQVFFVNPKMSSETQGLVTFRVLGSVPTQNVTIGYDSGAASIPSTFFVDFPKAIEVDSFS